MGLRGGPRCSTLVAFDTAPWPKVVAFDGPTFPLLSFFSGISYLCKGRHRVSGDGKRRLRIRGAGRT